MGTRELRGPEEGGRGGGGGEQRPDGSEERRDGRVRDQGAEDADEGAEGCRRRGVRRGGGGGRRGRRSVPGRGNILGKGVRARGEDAGIPQATLRSGTMRSRTK